MSENLQGREVEFTTAHGWNQGTVIKHDREESRLIVVDREGEKFIGNEWEFTFLETLPEQAASEGFALQLACLGM